MADLVLNQTVYQSEKKLITHYQNVSDNAETSTTVVVPPELSETFW